MLLLNWRLLLQMRTILWYSPRGTVVFSREIRFFDHGFLRSFVMEALGLLGIVSRIWETHKLFVQGLTWILAFRLNLLTHSVYRLSIHRWLIHANVSQNLILCKGSKNIWLTIAKTWNISQSCQTTKLSRSNGTLILFIGLTTESLLAFSTWISSQLFQMVLRLGLVVIAIIILFCRRITPRFFILCLGLVI